MTRKAHYPAQTTVAIAAAAFVGMHVASAAADPISFTVLPLAPLGGANALAAAPLVAGGPLDLALTNGTDLQILIGNGDGTFQPPVSYTAGTTPDAVAPLALDNGTQLLLVANFASNNVSILQADASGTLSPLATLPTGSGPNGFAVGDFGNGHQDFAVANHNDNTVSVFMGDGDGTFAPGATLATGSGPANEIAIGDFNGDGKLDLATANVNDGTVSVFLNNGNGTFAAPATYAVGASPSCIAAGAFAPGPPSLAVCTSNGVAIVPNNGDGTFGATVNFDIGTGPNGLAVGDLTGNGTLDVVTADQNGNSATILSNNAPNSLQAIDVATGIVFSVPADALTIGDFTDDGLLDIAVGTADRSAPGELFVQVPEPASLPLLGSSLLMLAGLLLRRGVSGTRE